MFDPPKRERDILRSETYLTPGYTPDQPINREELLTQIADAVRPLVHRSPPENLVLYGPAGVGKTTFVRHVLDRLEAETRVTTAYINCWQYNTRAALLTELLIQLGYPAPRKGKPVDTLLAKLQEWLDKHHSVVVALDEFDQLDNTTEIVYDLQQTSDDADNTVGLLLVSNRSPAALQLEPRSQSRLRCHPLPFQPYTRDELHDILAERAEQAFHPSAVTEETLELIAETVAAKSGDCRHALDLLLQAGRIAERERADTVGKEHVQHHLDSTEASRDR